LHFFDNRDHFALAANGLYIVDLPVVIGLPNSFCAPDNRVERVVSMKRVSVENIEDGMILSKDVCGPSGNILLSSGTQISAAIGRRLKNWGILQVTVEGEEPNQQADESAQISPEELRAHLEYKFEGRLGNPVMKKIFDAVFEYRLRKNR
jgi:hypothetical protein